MSVLLETTDGAVRYLTLNRPDRRNALNRELGVSLLGALEAASADAEVSVVVLTGAGSAFCAGADVAEARALVDAEEKLRHLQLTASLQQVVPRLDIPVLVAVNGVAVGAGAGLALSGDGILMSDAAALHFPELSHGMAPLLILPGVQRQVGRLAAFDILTRLAPVQASEAQARGWINRVVSEAGLTQETRAWAEQLAAIPRELLVSTKRLARDTSDMSLADALAVAVRAWPKD